jgi:hypothetical protein
MPHRPVRSTELVTEVLSVLTIWSGPAVARLSVSTHEPPSCTPDRWATVGSPNCDWL